MTSNRWAASLCCQSTSRMRDSKCRRSGLVVVADRHVEDGNLIEPSAAKEQGFNSLTAPDRSRRSRATIASAEVNRVTGQPTRC